ncbi:MAG: LLM class flavin-dependent oxidoreductase [Gammaproteobacteria bacterium]|nr:LLM class flavin-dependent oxidoreductase [Gammaproteobacteria bacterium]
MRLGLSFAGADPAGLSRKRMISDAQLVESAGFSSQWFFDAIGRGVMLPDPLIAVCEAAGATQHIEVGTCIMQVPLRRPAELAHRVMTAQLMTESRMLFGVGAGSTKVDFDLLDLDFDSRMAAFEEGLRIMRTLWRGEAINGVSIAPWASTLGGPPVLIGSWSGKVWIPKAAREFDGWIASGAKSTFNALSQGIEVFRSAGGKRAIVTNIQYDLDAPTTEMPDDGPFHLRCQPDEAKRRIERLIGLGYDDAVFVVPDRSAARLDGLRKLVG